MVQRALIQCLLTTSLSNRKVAARYNVAVNTAGRYRRRLSEEGLTDWARVSKMSEAELDAVLNRGRERTRKKFIEPDWEDVYKEMSRKGVTITLLYDEYETAVGEGGAMSEREFRRRYDKYRRCKGLVMRQPYQPGQHMFADFSGNRPYITDRETVKKRPVELFVASVGASRKTFAYATETQQLEEWVDVHTRAVEFFGAVTVMWVPDNLKSAVVSVSKKDGHVINPTYQDCADHYGTIVMPTRTRAPRDKAVVENAVGLAQRWILARLRNRTFFSIGELNAAIGELLLSLNAKPMRGRGYKSRNELFEELDRPAMLPLPGTRYEFSDWKINVLVGPDYLILYDDHRYSVPCRLVSSKVNISASKTKISVFHKGVLVASSKRSYVRGGMTVNEEHRPPTHRIYDEERVAELIKWAENAGTSVQKFLEQHLALYPPVASLQAFKGLKRLARDFGNERLDRACKRAIQMKASNVGALRSMLIRGLEDRPVEDGAANDPIVPHENIRGPGAYKGNEQ